MKVKKAYLPKWVAWFLLVIFVFTILFMYIQFQKKSISFDNFLYIVMLLLIILIVIFFVSYRQIPYLIMEVKS